jgi:TolB-like protein
MKETYLHRMKNDLALRLWSKLKRIKTLSLFSFVVERAKLAVALQNGTINDFGRIRRLNVVDHESSVKIKIL